MILHTMSYAEASLYKMMFGVDARMAIYEKIAAFLEDGVDLHTILKKLSEKYGEIGETDARAKILGEWAEGLNHGRPFAECIGDWAPAGETMLIQAGEQTGEISVAIRNAIFATTSVKAMKSKLWGELLYPIALIVALFGLMYMIATTVMPELAAVLPPAMWPGSSQGLYHVTEFVRTKWMLVIIGVMSFSISLAFLLPRMTGPSRDILDKLPFFSTYKSVQSAIFLISLASQMRSGVPIVDAINSMQALSNRYVSYQLSRILRKLNGGVVVGLALDSGFMDRETGVDIQVFGETSDLQDSMSKIGTRAIENTLDSIGTVAGMFRTIALVLLGAFIGWTFTSMQAITQTLAASAGV